VAESSLNVSDGKAPVLMISIWFELKQTQVDSAQYFPITPFLQAPYQLLPLRSDKTCLYAKKYPPFMQKVLIKLRFFQKHTYQWGGSAPGFSEKFSVLSSAVSA
jgi:hypothetical protein